MTAHEFAHDMQSLAEDWPAFHRVVARLISRMEFVESRDKMLAEVAQEKSSNSIPLYIAIDAAKDDALWAALRAGILKAAASKRDAMAGFDSVDKPITPWAPYTSRSQAGDHEVACGMVELKRATDTLAELGKQERMDALRAAVDERLRSAAIALDPQPDATQVVAALKTFYGGAPATSTAALGYTADMTAHGSALAADMAQRAKNRAG